MRKSMMLFWAATAVVSMLSFSAAPANAVTLPISAGTAIADSGGLVKNVGYWGYSRPYYGGYYHRYYRPYYRRYYHRPYGYYGRRYYYRPYRYYGHRYYCRPYRYYGDW